MEPNKLIQLICLFLFLNGFTGCDLQEETVGADTGSNSDAVADSDTGTDTDGDTVSDSLAGGDTDTDSTFDINAACGERSEPEIVADQWMRNLDCEINEDCTGAPNGWCSINTSAMSGACDTEICEASPYCEVFESHCKDTLFSSRCVYDECMSGSDCEKPHCLCNEEWGNRCSWTRPCGDDLDCESGYKCEMALKPGYGTPIGKWCHGPDDTCLSDVDCSDYQDEFGDYYFLSCQFDLPSGYWKCMND